MQDFYIDTFIIYNFLMDTFSLFLSAKIMRLRVFRGRMFASAAIGTLYAVLEIFCSKPYWFIFTVTLPFLMVLTAFDHRTKKHFLKATTLFWCISLLSGGIITAASNLLSAVGDSTRITALIIVLGASICLLLTKIIYKSIYQKISTVTCELRFSYMEVDYFISGIIDSGNLATEQTTGLPVVFVSLNALEKANINDCNLYVTAGGLGTKKTFPAFHPKKLSCIVSGKRIITDAVIAVDRSSDDYEGADSLVPMSII